MSRRCLIRCRPCGSSVGARQEVLDEGRKHSKKLDRLRNRTHTHTHTRARRKEKKKKNVYRIIDKDKRPRGAAGERELAERNRQGTKKTQPEGKRRSSVCCLLAFFPSFVLSSRSRFYLVRACVCAGFVFAAGLLLWVSLSLSLSRIYKISLGFGSRIAACFLLLPNLCALTKNKNKNKKAASSF